MNKLNLRAFLGLFALIIILAALIFTPVWTFNYWQAWVFLSVFFICTLAVTIYLIINDPKLLEKRVNAGPQAEKEPTQKIIQFFAQFAFILIIIFPSIDRRLSLSVMSPLASLFGDLLIALGLFIIFLVFRVNTYTSAIIEVDTDQKIITTGPYGIVRHPMYSGAIVMLIGTPIALGSWWGLLTVIPMIFVIILRLLDEEKYLAKNLSGYKDYQNKVKHRLVPLIW